MLAFIHARPQLNAVLYRLQERVAAGRDRRAKSVGQVRDERAWAKGHAAGSWDGRRVLSGKCEVAKGTARHAPCTRGSGSPARRAPALVRRDRERDRGAIYMQVGLGTRGAVAHSLSEGLYNKRMQPASARFWRMRALLRSTDSARVFIARS
jgi:hypothetical protein